MGRHDRRAQQRRDVLATMARPDAAGGVLAGSGRAGLGSAGNHGHTHPSPPTTAAPPPDPGPGRAGGTAGRMSANGERTPMNDGSCPTPVRAASLANAKPAATPPPTEANVAAPPPSEAGAMPSRCRFSRLHNSPDPRRWEVAGWVPPTCRRGQPAATAAPRQDRRRRWPSVPLAATAALHAAHRGSAGVPRLAPRALVAASAPVQPEAQQVTDQPPLPRRRQLRRADSSATSAPGRCRSQHGGGGQCQRRDNEHEKPQGLRR